jgi:putative phage-type endonuclease
MKSKIKLVPTATMSQVDWLEYRKQGIGASECGVVMGLSPYKSSLELFYDKIGEGLGFNIENLAMFLGKEQEHFIATLWEYWEKDKDTMIKNYRDGRKVRRCKRVNAYAHNPAYPWLFASLDREINQHGDRGNGTLELKTIGGYEADKWESGLPPVYVIQVQAQMLVCEMAYGEIAILKDNRDFMVLPFEFHESIAEGILAHTERFWKRVEEGRKIMTQTFEAKRTFNMRAVEELTAQLQSIEPEPDGSEAFNNFLKEKYRIAVPGERLGTIEELNEAQQHKEIANRIKELTETKQLHENRLKNVLRDGADKLDFGANGYVSWKSSNAGHRVFLNKTK